MMGREARGFVPEVARDAGKESERARGLLEGRWLTHGDVDVEGVTDAEKSAFVDEKLRETEAKMAKLADQARRLEGLKREYSGVPKEAAFSAEDEAWFKEGGDDERMTLQANWEASDSLDVDDISDAKKYEFARQKREELAAAIADGRLGDLERARERLARIELLEQQYKKGADAEKGRPN